MSIQIRFEWSSFEDAWSMCVCACDQAEAFEHSELSQCLVDLENLRYHSAGENFQLQIMN